MDLGKRFALFHENQGFQATARGHQIRLRSAVNDAGHATRNSDCPESARKTIGKYYMKSCDTDLSSNSENSTWSEIHGEAAAARASKSQRKGIRKKKQLSSELQLQGTCSEEINESAMLNKCKHFREFVLQNKQKPNFEFS